MARRRDGLPKRTPPILADQSPHVTPCFAVIEAIERVTRRHTRFAAAATIQIDFERKLLPGQRHGHWDQPAIVRRPDFTEIMRARKFLDRRQRALLGYQFLKERSLAHRHSLSRGDAMRRSDPINVFTRWMKISN